MQINLPWVVDPKTKEPSVSLTLLMISLLGALTAVGLHLAKVTDNVSTAMELFYATTALYFGRRFNMNGKTFSSEQTDVSNNAQGGTNA